MSANRSPLTCASAYDFMAALGVRTLHPGGRQATERLIRLSHLAPGSHVLDVGCGAGTTPIYLARRYGCQVSAVDISPDMVARARSAADRAGLNGRLELRVGDAHALPFEDERFDEVLSEAVLSFTDKPRALAEYLRVVRPGGSVAALELSWREAPPAEIVTATRAIICPNLGELLTASQWVAAFEAAGLEDVQSITWPMDMGISEFLRNEGPANALRIWLHALTHRERRAIFRRMMQIFGHFNAHHRYFGVGVFVGRKPA